MLCEYGCGQEAKYQFKNGKWCCNYSQLKCPKIREKNSLSNKGRISSEKSRKKISDSNKGKIPWNKGKTNIFSEETRKKISDSSKGRSHTINEVIRKKISDSNKGKIISEETRKRISEYRKGKFHSKESRKKISEAGKLLIEHIQEKYPTFFKEEEMRYDPDKPGEKTIQVHCKNSKCENSKENTGWFSPKNHSQLMNRIYAIEHEDGNGAIYFYCSDHCKQTCDIYNKRVTQLIKEDQIRAGIIEEPIYTYTEHQTFRKEVLQRANNICEYCGSKAIHVHHSRPQKLEPGFALDPDFGIACCVECHYKYGHKDECSTGKIANVICKGN